ncbi:MAG: DNA/RNA helicase domain-containing protein [Fusobacteriaceae bacterium]
MITYIPNKDIIIEKIDLLKIEKDILNHFNSQLRNSPEKIEIYVHSFVHNIYLNLVIIYENKGIFIITEKELKSIEKNTLKKYFNTYLKVIYKRDENEKEDYFHFSELEKTNKYIFNEFQKYIKLLNKLSLEKLSDYEEIVQEFKTILFKRYNNIESDTFLEFNKKQQELILKDSDFKVKGAAGTGKTLVMLTKAVRAYREHKHTNLIVVFNITARNILRQKLNSLYKDIDNSYFRIVHYHGLKKELNKIPQKYDNIFVDEAQDFEREWYNDIEKFIKENGKKYIFGDEKQNIYMRGMSEKDIRTPIKGGWNKLQSSYRLDGLSIDLALNFQKQFYANKYYLDNIEKKIKPNFSLCFDSIEKIGELEYKYFESYNSFQNLDVVSYIKNLINDKNLVHNKTAILTAEIKKILPIMNSFNEYVNVLGITSETLKEYEELGKPDTNDSNLEAIRRNRKLNFESLGDFLIFSTIHSFKGLERDNIILVISDAGRKMESKMDELVYTGITRAKNNLYIINIALEKYNEFFNKNIKLAEVTK